MLMVLVGVYDYLSEAGKGKAHYRTSSIFIFSASSFDLLGCRVEQRENKHLL